MHIFHKWSKWERYEQQMLRQYGSRWPVQMQMQPMEYTENMQRRHCLTCGKCQEEEVKGS